ncbi:MAG: hypothetical protein IEMM0008_1443 [bacterium]|nr:MAG: hypothetical protein IEMM0008_1443 [bacterium]
MKSVILVLCCVFFMQANSIRSQDAGKTDLKDDETRLFYQVNAMRKDRRLRPLKFSPSLYEKAKSNSEKMAQTLDLIKDKSSSGNLVSFNTVFSSGTNYVEEFVSKIRDNFAYYRTVINSDYVESAIAIRKGKKTGLFYMSQWFKKVNGTSDAYYLEAKEFSKLLAATENEISFGLNRNTILKRLDRFIHDPRSIYTYTLTSNSINIALNDKHKPYDYIQMVFSNSEDIITGFHTKSYFFKEQEYAMEKVRLDGLYSKEEGGQSPWYYHREDNNLRLNFWISQIKDPDEDITGEKKVDVIVEFRWLGKEGVYVTIVKTLFGLRYVNRYRKNYNLEHPIRKGVYLRLLKEFLKRSPYFEVTDFMKHCKVTFKNQKEVIAEMNYRGDRIKIKYYYHLYGDLTGQLLREELYLNNKKENTWHYEYTNQKLTQIRTVSHTGKSPSKTYPMGEKN